MFIAGSLVNKVTTTPLTMDFVCLRENWMDDLAGPLLAQLSQGRYSGQYEPRESWRGALAVLYADLLRGRALPLLRQFANRVLFISQWLHKQHWCPEEYFFIGYTIKPLSPRWSSTPSRPSDYWHEISSGLAGPANLTSAAAECSCPPAHQHQP